MHKARRGLIFRSIVLFVVFSIFTTSIVFAEMFTPLKKDKLPNAKVSAVIFGRVYMTSQFESFNKAPGKTYIFKGIKNDDQKKFAMTLGIKTLSDRWKGGDGVWGYDSFFALGAEPGNYSFETVTYNFQNFELNDVMRSAQGYINQLTLPFRKNQLIEPGKLIYCGVINITFVSFELDDRYQFSYQYNLKVSNDIDNDLDQFKTAYPILYEQFKDNIVIADFVKQ